MSPKPRRLEPGPGQESVWDYPRPPRIERIPDRLRVMFAGATIADTTSGYRVLETSHPPVYYLPPSHVNGQFLVPATGRTICEFKGVAEYWSLAVGDHRSERAAWSYAAPTETFAGIKDYLAFYASRVDACWVGDERVNAQEGDFYGGWITSSIVGPFKGPPGTLGW